jgi:hypothetical protein
MQDLTTATNVPLAIEVYCSIKNQNGNFTLLSEDSINKLDRQLLDRCLQITGGRQFFLTFPSQTNDILRMWSKLEKEHLNNYLQLTFTNHPDLLPKFLLATVREVATIGEGKPRKDDLSQQAYEFLKSVVDVDMLAKLIEKHLPVDMREVVISTVNNGIEQTPENATKQFIFWHERVSP